MEHERERHHNDTDGQVRRTWRVSHVSFRLPFMRYSLSREPTHDGAGPQARISVHSPFGTWEFEGEDLLQAAGRRAQRERDVRSRETRDTISAAIVGLVASALASAVGSGWLAGGGLAVIGATVAVSLVLLAVALRTVVVAAGKRRHNDVADRPLPRNVDRLARELKAGRRSALDLRRPTTPEKEYG